MKTTAGARAVNFYTGIDLRKLNKDRKPYTVVVAEKQFSDEIDGVKNLKKWEREILTDVFP